MTRKEMIATVDGEIGRLEQIRGLLKDSHSERFTLPGEPTVKGVGKRVLSTEALRRIAQGQQRRWVEQKKRADGKVIGVTN